MESQYTVKSTTDATATLVCGPSNASHRAIKFARTAFSQTEVSWK